ncbi:MAG TPA: carbamoyltransferase HypF [Rubrobacteraceae bacterium]|nr:carbamoyltransferase HypF [Rubrobacteraceae bacterium]
MRIPTRERREVSVRGIVQGVGFRPFVYALARKHGLTGLVRNDAEGVRIEAEGTPEELERFVRALEEDAPPLAVVESVEWKPLPALGDREFRIEESREGLRRRALVSPDVATCDDCLAELLDPADRRYRYPFTNCTNCGPRFTITRQVPYDRATTTMCGFTMCPECLREYDDPADRRFHAQPNACPVCGPRVRLVDKFGSELRDKREDPIARTARMLRGRAVVAIKGLGGYHLACDPFDEKAVRILRGRKVRQDKPFAIMARDLAQARDLCRISPQEEALLTSPARPIVLLERKEDSGVAEEVAPRQKTLGLMLAYTPLHHLLLRDAGIPLVMTSGNNSDEPIAYRDGEAFDQLCEIADYFLVHDREIHMRCDDSVVRAAGGRPYPIRRSRGYAPAPLRLAGGFSRHTLACGGELKNTFCLAKDRHAFLSHHIGDMENYETLRSFREGIEHYSRLFDVQPELVAYDLHPEYLSTKYARELEEAGLPAVGIQHHHAHVASCLADNERPAEERVIGVALDGTGYGTDGAVWGGEFFEGSVEEGFTRRAHLEYAPLPGGSAAIKQPWRMALAYLISLHGEEETLNLPLAVVREAGERNARLIARLVQHKLNTPPTSSAGRLFDAVAALAGVPGSQRTTYEGQAAIELELAATGPTNRAYPVQLRTEGDGWVVETRQIVAAVVEDLLAGRPAAEVSATFHRTMAEIVTSVCEAVREAGGAEAVALSGGTFQNMLLLNQMVGLLEEKGFVVHVHRRVPANDGGISLGQAVLADRVMREREA